MSKTYILTALLFITGYFIDLGAMQSVQPNVTTTIAVNQMRNATFHCTCKECSLPPYLILENRGTHLSTNDKDDKMILDRRGITYSRSGISAVVSIPDRVENNNTLVSCAAHLFGITEFSKDVELIIIGPPLPPEPVLVINSSSQLDIRWEIPYSHRNYTVECYNILVVNASSGDELDNVPEYNGTKYTYTFEDDVQYCQMLTVNVTAISALGSSEPGSVSRGFPIAPHQFEMNITVKVTFLGDGTPMANISFIAPLICEYQTATYTIVIEDILEPEDLLTRQSTYTGRNRSVVEIFTSGLELDHNYTLSVSVVENHFKIEVSNSANFSTLFRPTGATGTSPDSHLHKLGIYIGVPVGVLLFLLVFTILIVVILVCSIVGKKKQWRVPQRRNVEASNPASMYETINDYQTQQDVKANIHLSPQQQEFLWKVQHAGHHGERPRDDSYYQDMSSAPEGVRITTGPGYSYPPYSANQNQGATRGNPYFQQPCPAAAGSTESPVLGRITVTGPISPTMVVFQGGVGEILDDDDQDYTVMSQAGTLSSQNTTGMTVAEQQGQSVSGASGNVAVPMYSVVNKGEPSKPQKIMVSEC